MAESHGGDAASWYLFLTDRRRLGGEIRLLIEPKYVRCHATHHPRLALSFRTKREARAYLRSQAFRPEYTYSVHRL